MLKLVTGDVEFGTPIRRSDGMIRVISFGIYGILRLFSILQQGKGLIKVNGQPLSLVQPEILRFKVRFLLSPTLYNSLPRQRMEKVTQPRSDPDVQTWQRGTNTSVNKNHIFLTSFLPLRTGLRAPPDRWR